MAIHVVPKNKLGDPYFLLHFLKFSLHNYQFDQAFENFKCSFCFDGITLSSLKYRCAQSQTVTICPVTITIIIIKETRYNVSPVACMKSKPSKAVARPASP